MAKDENYAANILCAMFCMPVNVATRGAAITINWTWFAVPLGLPAIGFWHAVGLCTLVACFNYSFYDVQKEKPADKSTIVWLLTAAFFNVAICLISIGFGWVYKSFMGD